MDQSNQDRSSQDVWSQVGTGDVKLGLFKSSQVDTCQIKSGLVKCGQDRPIQFGSSKIKSWQAKSIIIMIIIYLQSSKKYCRYSQMLVTMVPKRVLSFSYFHSLTIMEYFIFIDHFLLHIFPYSSSFLQDFVISFF